MKKMLVFLIVLTLLASFVTAKCYDKDKYGGIELDGDDCDVLKYDLATDTLSLIVNPFTILDVSDGSLDLSGMSQDQSIILHDDGTGNVIKFSRLFDGQSNTLDLKISENINGYFFEGGWLFTGNGIVAKQDEFFNVLRHNLENSLYLGMQGNQIWFETEDVMSHKFGNGFIDMSGSSADVKEIRFTPDIEFGYDQTGRGFEFTDFSTDQEGLSTVKLMFRTEPQGPPTSEFQFYDADLGGGMTIYSSDVAFVTSEEPWSEVKINNEGIDMSELSSEDKNIRFYEGAEFGYNEFGNGYQFMMKEGDWDTSGDASNKLMFRKYPAGTGSFGEIQFYDDGWSTYLPAMNLIFSEEPWSEMKINQDGIDMSGMSQPTKIVMNMCEETDVNNCVNSEGEFTLWKNSGEIYIVTKVGSTVKKVQFT